MTIDLTKFPKHTDVLKSINRLNKIEWPKFDESTTVDKYVKTIIDLIQTEFEYFTNIIKIKENKDFLLPIYRVRELDTFTNIDSISEHSYPPIYFATLGRCNFPKYPVFYCSDNPMIALLEVVKENNYKNKKYCISKWEVQQTSDKLIFQSFLNIDLPSVNPFNILKDAEIEQLNEPFSNRLDEEQVKGLQELMGFLQRKFIEDIDFSISASLAHNTIYAKHPYATDILFYPSVQSKYQGVNMALHPNFVDNNLMLKRLYMVELKNIDIKKECFQTEITRYATVEKNILRWKNIKSDDEIYKKLMQEDFCSNLTSDFQWEFNKI
jgi:hypothetical protein